MNNRKPIIYQEGVTVPVFAYPWRDDKEYVGMAELIKLHFVIGCEMYWEVRFQDEERSELRYFVPEGE